jgi:heterodisulfide reductase subunit A
MKNVGIFVCKGELEGHRLELTSDDTAGLSEAKWIGHHPALCSSAGNDFLEEVVRKEELKGVIVLCPYARLFREAFHKQMIRMGIPSDNTRLLEVKPEEWGNGKKAESLAKALREVREDASDLSQGSFIKKALVIGGGIAGISASIDLGNAGYDVVLVEKLPSIGGRMLQLSETFPTLDCAQCTLTPKTVETGQHPHIRLLTYSEVDEVTGKAGDFRVRIRRKAAYVDWTKCTGCGLCQQKCPSKNPSEFDRGMGMGKAIYTLSPQAVPNKPVINASTCRYLKEGKCKVCEKICPVGAIDYEQKDSYVEEKVGAIIVAAGFDLIPQERFGEYGQGTIPDVIDGLAFERLNSASGPTTGEIRRPSDGTIPKEVVFIQCTGSRDPERYLPYCSRVCCMYTAKHARLYKHKVHDGQAYIFYMDIRSTGKGYEEFIQQGMEEEGILYLRGRVARMYRDGDKVVVWGVDTLTGKKIEVSADMVVLATALTPQKEAKELARKLGISVDDFGFITEAQRKLRPVETDVEGIFVAGCAQGPKDIADAVAHANAAASKVQGLFAQHGNNKSVGG